jgi:hypothetical protein
MPAFIPARGRTPHLAGVCVNRIGTQHSNREVAVTLKSLMCGAALSCLAATTINEALTNKLFAGAAVDRLNELFELSFRM